LRKLFYHVKGSGVILSVLSAFVFSISGMILKLLSSDVPFTESAFFRSFVGLVMVVIYMLANGYSFRVKNKKGLLLRGLFGGIAMLFYFYGVYKIKLGEVSILFQLTPVFVVIFALWFLKERLPRFFYWLIVLSILGVLMIVKPGFSSFEGFAPLVVVLSALFSALAYICIRELSKEHRVHIIVFYFCIVSTLVTLPFVYEFIMPSLYELFMLVMLGVVATLAQFIMTKAYSLEQAGVVSMLSYVGVFFSVAWGYLIWGEELDLYSVIGGIIIIASCSILSYKIYTKNKVSVV
jgi:drug/metabolite transporter (DMT)-like permease